MKHEDIQFTAPYPPEQNGWLNGRGQWWKSQTMLWDEEHYQQM